MMMREIVVTYRLLLATLFVASTVGLGTASHAESKKGGWFGKPVEQDWTPGGDPTKGPGLLDNATIRMGGTVIRTGTAAERYNAANSGANNQNSDRERAAREMQNRETDAGTPR